MRKRSVSSIFPKLRGFLLMSIVVDLGNKPRLLPSRTPSTVTWRHFFAFLLFTTLLVWSCTHVDTLSVILRVSAGSSAEETVLGLLLIFEISTVVGQFAMYFKHDK